MPLRQQSEGIWAIVQASANSLAEDAELERMLNDVSDLDEDDDEDFAMVREESEERRKCLEYEDP